VSVYTAGAKRPDPSHGRGLCGAHSGTHRNRLVDVPLDPDGISTAAEYPLDLGKMGPGVRFHCSILDLPESRCVRLGSSCSRRDCIGSSAGAVCITTVLGTQNAPDLGTFLLGGTAGSGGSGRYGAL
jgi:hypothetical protein